MAVVKGKKTEEVATSGGGMDSIRWRRLLPNSPVRVSVR